MPTFGSIAPDAPDTGQAAPVPYGEGTSMAEILGRIGRGAWRSATNLIDTARSTPYGLRREDVTDIPGSAQPIDPLVGRATGVAAGMVGGPVIGPAEAGGTSLGSSALRQAIQKPLAKALSPSEEAAPETSPAAGFGSIAPGKADEDALLRSQQPSLLHRIHEALSLSPSKTAGLAVGALPGAGVADVLGYMPNLEGGTYPSFGQNVRAGRYGQAGLQTLGLAGDLMLATPAAPLGELAKEAAAAGKPAGGLTFPAEEAADRLRLKLARETKAAATGTDLPGMPANPRTVIKAPEGSSLPDFVAGKITPEDWVARHEALMTPDEMHNYGKWYDTIYGEFLKHTGGDEALAKQYMRGWLVGQQNIDVTGAMGNMMLQREQILRGVPEEQMAAGGMPNPTVAARRVMQNRPIEAGVGQKISDFVDAAEGKNVRSWMGNDPSGGSPFVVDVHTARDTGMVDQELLNHLKRQGYNPDDLAKLKIDLKGTPSETQYENRGNFGRDLTDYLNNRNWQGRNDWTPKEIQAIGWMGMRKLTGAEPEDIMTGLRGQSRNISMELAPGEGSPWAAKFGDRFNALSPQDQYALTHQMTQSAINRASQISGVDVRNIAHGTGGWQAFQNPSTVAQTFASKQGADIAANALGHMLQQTEVWSNKVKPATANPKGFALDIIGEGDHALGTDAGLRDTWGKIMAADPTGLLQGYQPIRTADGRVGIRALIDKGGAKTQASLEKALAGPINGVLKQLPGDYHTRFGEAEITKARNDWTKEANGQGYTSRLVQLLGRDPTADLNSHGAALEKEFSQALDALERKRK